MHSSFPAEAAMAPALPFRSLADQASDVFDTLEEAISNSNVAYATHILQECTHEVRTELGRKFLPLHAAAQTPLNEDAAKEMTSMLLTFFPNAVREYDDNGKTPLHIAAGAGLASNVAALLDAGADISAKDHQGWTAFFWAIWSGVVEVVDKLLQTLGLTEARSRPRPSVSPEVPLIEQRDDEKRTPFMIAAGLADKRVAEMLLDFGADINARNERGETALVLASRLSDANAVDWLLAHGAQTDLSDANGMTALFHASSRYDFDVVVSLLKSGARYDIMTRYGESAQDHAQGQCDRAQQLKHLFAEYRGNIPLSTAEAIDT